MNVQLQSFVLFIGLLKLQFLNAKWICSSDTGSTDVSDFEVNPKSFDTLTTCILKESYISKEGTYYFVLEVDGFEENFEIGIVSANLLVGTSPQSFFYKPQLSKWESVEKHFANAVKLQHVKAGTIGIVVKVCSDKIELLLIQDGKLLGLAFSNTKSKDAVLPAIRVNGEGKVKVLTEDLSEEIKKEEGQEKRVLYGSYKLTKLNQNDERTPNCVNDKIKFMGFNFGNIPEISKKYFDVLARHDGTETDLAFDKSANWEYIREVSEEDNRSTKNECIRFFLSVLQDAVSFIVQDSKLVVKSSDDSTFSFVSETNFGKQKSFEAEKLTEML